MDRIRKFTIAAGIVGLVFSLAACGPDDDSPDPDLSGCLETNHGLNC